MSVPVQDPINQFIIAGGETSGPWTWNLQKEEDLVVFKQLASTGAIVPLVLNTDYTVNPAGLNNDNGGTIDFLAPQLPAAVGDIWTLLRDTAIDRSEDFATKGAFLAKTINGQLDELTRITQDQKRDIGTAVRKDPGVGDALNPLIPQPVDERALKVRDAGGGNFDIVMSDNDPDQQVNDAAASAAAALASEQAAAISETGAETAETGAETAETGAEAAQSAAETAQAASEAAAASGLYKNVFDIDFSDSPYTILNNQDGFLIQVDETGGNVIVNLPDSTGLSADFRVGVARMTAGGNTLDVQRQGTDTINGGTSVPIATQYQTLNLILDQSQGEYLATDISLANLSSPPPIGDVTPNTIEGTIIKANTRFEGSLGSTNPAAVKATTFEGDAGGTTVNEFSVDGTLAGNSDDAVPTEKAVKTAIAAAGKVLQIVETDFGTFSSTSAAIPSTTVPQSGEGTEFFSVAITPKFASSTLFISVDVSVQTQGTTGAIIALFKDSAASAIAGSSRTVASGGTSGQLSFQLKIAAGSTSAQTFKIRAGSYDSGTIHLNSTEVNTSALGAIPQSSIRIMEVGP